MDYNDYELVALAKENNEDAISLIYSKYKPIIVKKSKDAFLSTPHYGVDINDIIQECYIALDEAIRKFQQDNNASFYTFANICIDRKITNYLRKSRGVKDKLLNEAVTLDDSLEYVISDDINLEDMLTGKDNENKIIDDIKKVLTTFENKVFELRLNNYSCEEIAKKLNKDSKSIYNTLHRIRVKIKKFIKIDD